MLDDFFKKIAVLEEFDIAAETIKIINSNSIFISDLLKEQLRLGRDGQGKNVTVFGRDFYSDRTTFNKEFHGQGFGKFTEWITNYMTGAFYTGIKVKAEGVVFSLSSSVDYYEQIITRSGAVIMELDEQSLRVFSEEILFPQIQQAFSLKFNS